LCRFCEDIFRLFSLLFLACSIIGSSSVVEASKKGSLDNPVKMIFVPSGDSQAILTEGSEIADLLSKKTGLSVKAKVATSYAAAIEAIGANKVDIGWLATFSYVLAKDKYDVDLLLIVSRFGSPTYRGQILVKENSGIKTLNDLKGKRMAFVDPASTSGHIFPKTLLLSKGISPEKFFSKSVFAGSHNAVIFSILKGEVDAGATYDDARAAVAKGYPDVYKQTRVLAYTKDIPNDTVCASKGLDPVIKEKIKNGLRNLSKDPKGSMALKRIYGISELIDFDALFDPVRKARKLLGLDPTKFE
jgi:phosphonate transport system substrate-binding protein